MFIGSSPNRRGRRVRRISARRERCRAAISSRRSSAAIMKRSACGGVSAGDGRVLESGSGKPSRRTASQRQSSGLCRRFCSSPSDRDAEFLSPESCPARRGTSSRPHPACPRAERLRSIHPSGAQKPTQAPISVRAHLSADTRSGIPSSRLRPCRASRTFPSTRPGLAMRRAPPGSTDDLVARHQCRLRTAQGSGR